ncbi:MAG: GNAT family N-acetyltransferase [Gemmatimonadetes bacterium]|nr:MAG: GNAT family N-acetyltransferase [Gemmatimonadota bacterium]
MTVEIPPITALKSIKQLLRDAGLPYEDLTPLHLDHFFVAGENGAILGTVGLEICDTHHALLRSLVVSPGARERGLGTQLVNTVEQYARRKGISYVFLLTTTASAFFAKHGYALIPREDAPDAVQQTAEFKNICPSSARCMFKRLDS